MFGFDKRVAVDFYCESLENRRLLAGTVTARVEMGNLVIVGDGRSNEIEVTVAIDSDVTVTGLNGTTVEWLSPSSELTGTGITIVMKGGHDRVNFVAEKNADLNLQFDMGGGRDDLDVEASRWQVLDIETAGGIDDVFVSGGDAANLGSVQVASGGGLDKIELRNVLATSAEITTGGGNDYIVLFSSAFSSTVQLVTGAGNDSGGMKNTSVNELQIWMAGGPDHWAINSSVVANSAFLDSGSGNDRLVILGASSVHGLVANMGGGADVLEINGPSMILSDTDVDTGGGSDRVHLRGARFESQSASTEIVTGGGADEVEILDTLIAHSASINTGGGADVSTILGSDLANASLEMDSGRDLFVIGGLAGFVSASGGSGVDQISIGLQQVGSTLNHEAFELVT